MTMVPRPSGTEKTVSTIRTPPWRRSVTLSTTTVIGGMGSSTSAGMTFSVDLFFVVATVDAAPTTGAGAGRAGDEALGGWLGIGGLELELIGTAFDSGPVCCRLASSLIWELGSLPTCPAAGPTRAMTEGPSPDVE